MALLLAAAWCARLSGAGLAAGFALLAALLLGAALLLPLLLSRSLDARRAAVRRASLAQWFWADTRQQMPGLSLALMALLLALAANVGVGHHGRAVSASPSPAGSTSAWRPSST